MTVVRRCPGCGGELLEERAILCGGPRGPGGRRCRLHIARYCPKPECRAIEASPGLFIGRDGKPITSQQALDL